jgi:hypothetical protein
MALIRPRERDAVLQSLRAGVVPRMGQHLIQVGRAQELRVLIEDIDRIADGGSTFRLIIGEYGAGKTFFLNLVRSIALEKKLVTIHADLNPDRRLHASGGQARSLYAELARNMATRTKPEGGALAGILEKFITQAKSESEQTGVSTDQIVRQNTKQLAEMVNGYDLPTLYWPTGAVLRKTTNNCALMRFAGCAGSSLPKQTRAQPWEFAPS